MGDNIMKGDNGSSLFDGSIFGQAKEWFTTMTGGANETSESSGTVSLVITSLLSILQFLIFCYAIYLSVKCNQGFNFGSFLAACCCSPCYVAYRLAMGTKGCLGVMA
jgi:hypothetical protein